MTTGRPTAVRDRYITMWEFQPRRDLCNLCEASLPKSFIGVVEQRLPTGHGFVKQVWTYCARCWRRHEIICGGANREEFDNLITYLKREGRRKKTQWLESQKSN